MIPKPIAYLAQESNSPTQARRAINAGFKSVALDLSIVTAEAVKVARDAGLFVAAWGPVSGLPALPAGTQAFIGQIESPEQYNGTLKAMAALKGVDIKLAVVTTYWGLFDPTQPTTGDRWAALAVNGVAECQVECYAADGWPHTDLDRMLGQGETYGIPKSVLVPVIGTYHGEMPDVYSGLTTRVPNYGIYIIEQTSQACLDTLKEMKPVAAEPSIPDPATINDEISRLAHTWLDPHPGDDALSRLRAIDRIAQSTDTEWVNARSRIKAALDSVGA